MISRYVAAVSLLGDNGDREAAFRTEAALAFAAYGLRDWSFRINARARVRFGRCDLAHKVIELSRFHVETSPIEQVVETLLHEIAHAISRDVDHGTKWEQTLAAMKPARRAAKGWEVACVCCDYRRPLARRPDPSTAYTCPICAPDFDPRYRLVVRQRSF